MKKLLNKKHSLVSICVISLLASVVVARTQIFPQSPGPGGRGAAIDKLRFMVFKGGDPSPYDPPPPDEVLSVDGFNSTFTEWTEHGSIPYLNASGDGNYIEGTTSGAWQAWFSFENITVGKTAKKVTIEGYTDGPYDEGVDYDIYSQTFAWLGSLYGTGSPAWVSPRWIDKTVDEMHPAVLTEAGINDFEVMAYFYDPGSAGGAGNILDALRLNVWYEDWTIWQSGTAIADAMLGGYIDAATDFSKTSEIEMLSDNNYTVTGTPGFHTAHVGFNLQRPVLDDVNFRHALFHAYDQQSLIASIYRYAVTPARSLVPPAQGGWLNPSIPTHPFNPGDSTDAPGTHSTFGILKGAGYTYYGTGYGDLGAYWEDPLGDPLPGMTFYTPTYEVAPTEAEHGRRIVAEWNRCGLNEISHEPTELNTYTSLVFDDHDFDMYMMSRDLDRFPTHLYSMCHSSTYVPGSDHAVGLNDPTLDGYLETLKYSPDPGAQVAAAHSAQTHLYNEANPSGLAYMNLYSRVSFDIFTPGLKGIVKSPGYGSDNMWTLLNMQWEPGHPNERIESGKSVVVWRLGDEPSHLSPVASTTPFEWSLLGRIYDSLIVANPYTSEDVAWQADSWTIEGPLTTTITLDSDIDGGQYAGMNSGDSFNIIDGMKITYNLNSTLYWQDGNAVDAGDCEFGLEFLRDNEIPQFITTWQDIVDVQRVDADTFVVYANETSQFLLYNWAECALLLPPQVWSALDGDPLADILAYDPSTDTTDTGPWSYPANAMGPKTCLFGTGPLVFDFYDPVGMYADLHNWDADGPNVGYFKTTAEIHDVKVEMFHDVGDVNRDGVVDLVDNDRFDAAYGSSPGDGNWDPDCDLNLDNIIDYIDGALIASSWGEAREYPADIFDVEIQEVTTYPTAVSGQQVDISLAARYKGLVDREINFTYYRNDTYIGHKNVTWTPGDHTLSFTWDTTGVPIGTYTIKVISTILDDPTRDRLSDPMHVDGPIEFVTPIISVKPQISIAGSAGKDFSINITITNAPYNNTWAWQFKLGWDPTLLNITDINEGPFLNQDGTWVTAFVNVTNQGEGWVLASCTLLDDPLESAQPLPYGNGTFAIISFTVLQPQNGTLHLYDTVLLDYNIDSYSHTTQDGEFKILLGDINRDGIVDDEDVQAVLDAFGSVPGDGNWNPEADIWGPLDEPDGIIDVYDLAMIGKKYG